MNWTQKMPEEFKKLNGYDIMPWLPAMLGEIVESADATEKFAADLRKTTSHLVMKNFYGRLGERIRARGLKYESEPTNEASSQRPNFPVHENRHSRGRNLAGYR